MSFRSDGNRNDHDIAASAISNLRMHKYFNIEDAKTEIADGNLIMIDSDNNTFCIFVYQIIATAGVVKPIPEYIQKKAENLNGISAARFWRRQNQPDQ
jgi:chemotaxis protein histidine kinase CheA